VEVVSKVLGHARVSITLDVYRHVMDNERRALVVDLFDAPPAAPAFTVPALNSGATTPEGKKWTPPSGDKKKKHRHRRCFLWWRLGDSNPRPSACKADALPLS
jgi:hypothetical protein